MRNTPKILCLVTMTLFLLIILQGATHFVKVKPLKGAYVSAEKPQFAFGAFMTGDWQHQVDSYIKDHHGFREPAIRLYNQYLWSAYHRSTNPGSVVVGKDNYLFEPWFVDEYYTGCFKHFYPDSLLIPGNEKGYVFFQRMSRLAKLQAILEEQGVHLFLALLPGKERIYPQYLPAPAPQARKERMEQGVCSAYDHYSGWNSFYGFRCVDICHCFDSLKGHTPYLLFTQTGTHWSSIASTYAFDSIMRYMQTFGPAIRPVKLGKPYYARTREPDADLDELLNKTFHIPIERNQYVDVTLADPAPKSNPSLIVIGDSFFWNILYNYPIQDLFSDFRYWYYFSTIYYDPDHENVDDIDLVEELLSADYVMLSYCTVQLYNCGNGFINRALLELCYDPEEIQAVRDRLAADTTSTLSVDERIDRHLEQYFPALADDFPTKRCSRLTNKNTSYTSHTSNTRQTN
jgi:hypothetical protein